MAAVLDHSLSLEQVLDVAHGHYLAARYDDAAAVYRAIIERHPDCAPAHTNLGVIMLLHGRLEEGWAEFEWRRHAQPGQLTFWDGGDLAGNRILVRGEQGAEKRGRRQTTGPLAALGATGPVRETGSGVR